MKMVQSFWTAPAMKGSSKLADNRCDGGWPHERYHLMSWALSCLQLRKYYGEVELFTDHVGKHLLIDSLELPYTKVHVLLDELKDFNPQLWALGKVVTYSKQKEPFIHVDGDVFIWERFSKKLETAQLVAQNVEIGFSFYKPLLDSLIRADFWLPQSVRNAMVEGSSPVAYNAGILGGNDVAFLTKYTREALAFVNNNHSLLSRVNVGLFNTIYEQHLFHCMALEEEKQVGCQTEVTDKHELNRSMKSIEQFRNAPNNVKYIHLFGDDAKRDMQICMVLSGKLKSMYPRVHDRILEIVALREKMQQEV